MNEMPKYVQELLDRTRPTSEVLPALKKAARMLDKELAKDKEAKRLKRKRCKKRKRKRRKKQMGR